MKTIKTSEAIGPALDWLVLKALGYRPEMGDFGTFFPWKKKMLPTWHGRPYRPSTDWAQGGPIIERKAIDLSHWRGEWTADIFDAAGQHAAQQVGPSLLIAALRCFVASKLGATAEVPEELTCK